MRIDLSQIYFGFLLVLFFFFPKVTLVFLPSYCKPSDSEFNIQRHCIPIFLRKISEKTEKRYPNQVPTEKDTAL